MSPEGLTTVQSNQGLNVSLPRPTTDKLLWTTHTQPRDWLLAVTYFNYSQPSNGLPQTSQHNIQSA